MKAISVAACLFLTTVLAAERDITPDCYSNCVAFANRLKGKTNVNLKQEAREFCDDSNIKCHDVNRFARQVYILTKSGVSAGKICKWEKFCPKPKPVGGKVACTVCKTVVNTIKISLQAFNQTEKEIINAVAELCKILSPLKVQSQVCKDVLSYVDEIIQWVLKGLSPGDICIKLKLCNATSTHKDALDTIAALLPFARRKIAEAQQDLPVIINRYKKLGEAGASDSESCEICQTVTTIVKIAIESSNKTITSIEAAIEKFCGTKSEAVKEKCLAIVARMDKIAHYIEQRLSPGDVCKKLGYCPGSVGNIEFGKLKSAVVPERRTTKLKSKAACEICATVANIIQYSIQFSGKTIGQVSELVKTFCNKKPEEQREKCLAIVAQMDKIAQYIEQRLSPGDVCKKLGYCPGSVGNIEFGKLKSAVVPERRTTKLKSKAACEICATVANIIQYSIQFSGKTIGQVSELVKTFCNKKPEEQREKCLAIVAQMDKIAQYIEQRLSPGDVCKKLGYCPGSVGNIEFGKLNAAVAVRDRRGIRSNRKAACEICRTVTSIVEYSIKFTNSTIAEISELIEMFCNDKPEKQRSQCLTLVSRINEIANYIEQRLSPGKVCVQIGVCTSLSRRRMRMRVSRRHKRKTESLCRLCIAHENIIAYKYALYKSYSKKMEDFVAVYCRSSATPEMKEWCLAVAPVVASMNSVAQGIMKKANCKKIACNNDAFVVVLSLMGKRASRPCDMCSNVRKIVERRLKPVNGMVQNYMKNISQHFCTTNSKDFSYQCNVFVRRTTELFDDTREELLSRKPCKTVCSNRNGKQPSSFGSFLQTFLGNRSSCSICKAVVSASLGQGSAGSALKTIENACNEMEGFSKSTVCKTMLAHADDILKKGREKTSPEDTCRKLSLCGGKFFQAEKIIEGLLEGALNLFG